MVIVKTNGRILDLASFFVALAHCPYPSASPIYLLLAGIKRRRPAN
jgi:hypothetical protein